MELTGRLTADATTRELKEGRQVVNFSIAINDSFKAKGSDTATKLVTYVDCAYWLHAGIAPYLTKGRLVELTGRIGVNAWTNKDGEAQARLTFHVNGIKLHSAGKSSLETTSVMDGKAIETTEDLPF